MSKPRGFKKSSAESGGTFEVTSLSALAEYVRSRPQDVLSVVASEQAMRDAAALLAGTGISLTQGRPHGGAILARVRHRAGEFDELLEAKGDSGADLLIALDHITDPRNLGAIVRSAAFFGVTHVIAPTKRQVLFSPAAVETAQGGFARTQLVPVTNLARALRELKEHGYWILGAAMNGESVDVIGRKYERAVIVLGAEDKGLTHNIRETCDLLVSIPGARDGLDSLNVSVAAGILMARLAPLP